MDQAYVNQECLIEFSLWDGAAMLTGQAIDHLTGMHPMPKGAALGDWALDRAWPMLAT